jgi:hypothetical protein
MELINRGTVQGDLDVPSQVMSSKMLQGRLPQFHEARS